MSKKTAFENEAAHFTDYHTYIKELEQDLQKNYQRRKKVRERHLYFTEILFPLVFSYLKAGILEYQTTISEAREIPRAS